MNRNKIIGENLRGRIFIILVLISLASFIIYIYAIQTTTRNVARGQEAERMIAKMTTDLDSLEFAYIEVKNNVTIELANTYGFREVNNPLVVSRASSASLSFNTLNR